MPTSALPAMADLVTRPADDYRYLGVRSSPHEPNSSLQSPASSTNRGLCLPVSDLNLVAITTIYVDRLQSFKHFFINVSYHIIVASLTLMALKQSHQS